MLKPRLNLYQYSVRVEKCIPRNNSFRFRLLALNWLVKFIIFKKYKFKTLDRYVSKTGVQYENHNDIVSYLHFHWQ